MKNHIHHCFHLLFMSNGYFLLILGLSSGLVGCKTMTEAQRAAIEQEQKQVTVADQVQVQNNEAVAQLDEEERTLKLRALLVNRRVDRQEAYKEAVSRVMSGDAEGCLGILEPLLAEDEEAQRTYEEARAAGNEDEVLADESGDPIIPPMESVEKANYLVVMGAAKNDNGDMDGAIRAFSEAVDLDSGNRMARINLGKLQFSSGNFEEAMKAFSKELAAGYRSGENLFLLAQAQYEVGSQNGDMTLLEAARIAIDEARVQDPGNEEYLSWGVTLDFELKRYEEAIRKLDSILTRYPANAYYLELKARSFEALEQPVKAADSYESYLRIVGINKSTKQACLQLSDIYSLDLNQPDRGAIWFSRAFSDDLQQMSAKERFYYGTLLEEAGLLDDALQVYAQVEGDSDQKAEAISRKAAILMGSGKSDLAIEALESVTDINRNDGKTWLLLGDLYLDQGDLGEARDSYGAAAGLPVSKADGLAGLAEVAYEMGNLEQAVRYYEDAVAEKPEDLRFTGALEQIREELKFSSSQEG